MKRDDSGLSARQLLAVPIVAAEPCVERAAKKARVSRKTLYEWLREPAFRDEIQKGRREIVRDALDGLKLKSPQAVNTLTGLLKSKRAPTKLRAAEIVLQFAQKALEFEELERRIEGMEKRMSAERKWG